MGRLNGFILLTLVVFLSIFSPELIAQWTEPPEDAPWYVSTLKYILAQFPTINGWFAAAMIFIMSALRALSSLLNFIAAKTETTRDDEIAAWFSKALRWISAIVGWFGIGTSPKR